ncbi:peroxisomal membrane protein PEX14-like [Macadamia integrifolia]|uniref:peroxisomal membrane protein PEX14-like n=1 Tax=Macadamia integrifolia TaxID=60698 RepID=UPI001C4F81F4|nr:peroxisomal membrane protein PEX14-like [Macadamia integrifolia]XP_042502772.1 peroxisomal membrane protein PEX14-like [Macadamia integrifolia]XP_042502773.1 peroxisomal membrane protein PEX14-like [Macadamia integrifolia]
MGSESTTPPNVSDDKPQNQGSELQKPMDGNGKDAKEETLNETSSKSVFVNSEPMREEQVQNAIKFLSHPKVRGSPVIYRRSFLEKKGLTKEEIDEAFRRVPDPPPTVTSVQPATSNQDGQLKSSANMQAQVSTQTPQPAAAAPTGNIVSTVATMSKSRFHWSHAFLAVGLLAASGAGSALFFKHAIVPRLKSWIKKIVLEDEGGDVVKKNNSRPSLAEEAASAAKAAAAAAADVARASQEMLNSKNEEKKYFEAFRSLLDVQVEEMKSMSNAIRKLEATSDIGLSSNKQAVEHIQSASSNGPTNTSWKSPLAGQESSRGSGSLTSSMQSKVNGTLDFDLGSVRPSSAPASVEPSAAPHPKSYMEIMAMVQRGEKPPGIREINDLPPNPNQPPSNPRLAPRAKPWEGGQTQNNPSFGLQSHANGESSSSKEQDSRSASQLNGYSSEPWWRRKNVRITEIESEDQTMTTSNGAVGVTKQQVPQRVWVPPQQPPVAMPEAAAAIRQPKPLIQKEQTSNDQMTVHPSDDIDELRRFTKISESGGQPEINNESPSLDSNEIQNQGIAIEGN